MVGLNDADVVPTRGFLEEFSLSANEEQILANQDPQTMMSVQDVRAAVSGIRAWFPPGFPDNEARSLMAVRTNVTDPNFITLTKDVRSGFIQGAQVNPAVGNQQHTFLIFQEAKVNANNPTGTITPFQGATQIELRLSKQDVPSGLLTKEEFEQAFAFDGTLPSTTHVGYEKRLQVFVDSVTGATSEKTVLDLRSDPITQPGTPVAAMKIEVPQQGLKYTWNGFFDQDPTTPTTPPNDLIAGPGQLVGLKENTLMGSAFVHVTGGAGVTVEVGDRTGSNALQFRSTDQLPGTFSLQAPPEEGGSTTATAALAIESDGPLNDLRRMRVKSQSKTLTFDRSPANWSSPILTWLPAAKLRYRVRKKSVLKTLLN